MNRVARYLVIAALASVSTISVAAGNTSGAKGRTGAYVDLGLGLAWQQADYWDDNGIGLGAKAAIGYRTRHQLAVEFGVAGGTADMNPEGSSVDVEDSTTTIYGAVVGFYPLSEKVELFGRLGLGISSTVSTISDSFGTVEAESDSEGGPVYGAGVAWAVGSSAAVTFEYNHFSDDRSDEVSGFGPNGLDMYSVGVRLHF